MFKNFLVRTMLKARGVPEEQINLILAVVEKNPALFKQIAEEIEAKVKAGKKQEDATMEVMTAHQEELKGLLK